MAVNTSLGTSVWIGPVTAAPPSVAGYAALAWTQIGSVNSVSEFGDQSNMISYDSLPQKRIRKVKGSDDAGQLILSCGADPLDAGQLALSTARGARGNYAVKILLEDQASDDDLPSVFYFLAKVSGNRMAIGDANAVLTREFILEIDSPVLEVPSVVLVTGGTFDLGNPFNLLFNDMMGVL